MNDLLEGFRFAPIGLQILPLGDCESLLATADELAFRSLIDRITAVAAAGHVGVGRQRRSVGIRNVQRLPKLLRSSLLSEVKRRNRSSRRNSGRTKSKHRSIDYR